MPKTFKKAKKTAQVKAVPFVTKQLPSYWVFTKQVYIQLNQSRNIFLKLLGLLTATIIVLTITDQQSTYIEQASGIQSVSNEVSSGALALLLQAGVLFMTLVTGTLTANLTEIQQFILGFAYLYTWLAVIWLLRQILSTKNVSLRDGVYNAGAPIISSVLVILVAFAQLLPLAILTALLSSIATTGAVNGVLVAVGFLLILAMAVVTLYWLVGTLFAAIIVTISGTYPIAALKSARKIVRGIRPSILKRVLWLLLLNAVTYTAILIPILFIDVMSGYVLSWIVVIVHIVVSLSLLLFSSSYLYLLYRRIIDEQSR